ncbi:coiled-coil domain-containing protein 78 isoform X2 [Anolis carolinensis]|uniref:coiled-coil domain-containing protein 78 isoform X2 n=1 Tax=Anolis carolinensis TaxID=28377 RepID=UPI00046294DF|nr:PREDICTED: coiled-coil domain-containing protein 78 isoform X2 [Anolis carolinensis]|eukprot:XP_008119243.1 PREDICTED: coiled-coil domain-containing protein 78 isoform X2 [Anolis carolinensis]
MEFGSGPQNFQEQVQRLANENVQLQDRNERLYSKIGELQEKMGGLAGSKTDLSSRLIHSEEEKLKISKDFVDFQIQTNKMREQHEAENFELKNLILTLENRILEVELHAEKMAGERNALRERLQALEDSRKELADEYLELKSNYLALGKEHGQEPEDVVASEYERQKLEKSVFGNQDHFTREIEQMKEMYHSQQQKLEERMVSMGKELQEAKKEIRSTQHKLAEQSEVLLSSQSQLQEVEAENSRLQLRLKELVEEYRSRLVQYITDLAEYMDNKSATKAGKAPSEPAHMKRFVDNMLKDIRASYKSREEQLAGAARGYKKRLQNVVKRHEGLLVAYRMQREQIRCLGSNILDPGPPEHHFSITDAELLTNTSQELNRLREDKANLEGQLHELQMKVKLSENAGPRISPPYTLDEAGWDELKKQLREFTHRTQEDLEKERSQLLARATVAEEQVAELQDYVDKHLGRYKEEILRLRKLLGTDGLQTSSARTSNAPRASKPKRNVSKET